MNIQEWDWSLSDQVQTGEPARRFAARELRARRLPLWVPDYFAGVPFAWWPTFSPFALLACLTDSPVILAWKELATALVAGVGMYVFARRVLKVAFWPAVIAAWCYPLTGFFVIWQGVVLRQTVCLLPWLLLAVDMTARGKSGLAVIALSFATGLTLVAGQLDVAGQVLLVSGIYAMWCIWNEFGVKCFSAPARRAMLGLALGWMLGFMLAAPYVAPSIEYVRTGSRMVGRSEGAEERPPGGLVALPHIFVPDYYGRTTCDTWPIFVWSPIQRHERGEQMTGDTVLMAYPPGNLQESAVGAYAGVLAMLFAAPLAFWSRRHRSVNLFLVGLAFLGVGWVLDVPILVRILRLPGLNIMSHNRLVFATSFAFTALAGVGLEVLSEGALRWRRWHRLFAVPVTFVAVLCIHRAIVLPEPVATKLGDDVSQGKASGWVQSMNQVRQVQSWYRQHLLVAGAICAAGTVLWLVLALRKRLPMEVFFPLACTAMIADLIWFTQNRQPLCDPSLYYPSVPALEQTAQAAPGRIVGYGGCLPANLASMVGLRDVRGYDGVDPAAMVELLMATAATNSVIAPYARTMLLSPKITFSADGHMRLPGILDMLQVRYVVCRALPQTNAHPLCTSPGYYVLENTNALARPFIPRRIECVPDHDERLLRLESPDFDPRATAFLETPVELPRDCRGQAGIREEIPTRVRIDAQMETAGLVVLSDQWNSGWRAYLDGQSAPILRANHAVRGVVVPQGMHRLEFRYEPASFKWGLRLAGVAALLLLGWSGFQWRAKKAGPKPNEPVRPPAPGNQRGKLGKNSG